MLVQGGKAALEEKICVWQKEKFDSCSFLQTRDMLVFQIQSIGIDFFVVKDYELSSYGPGYGCKKLILRQDPSWLLVL